MGGNRACGRRLAGWSDAIHRRCLLPGVSAADAEDFHMPVGEVVPVVDRQTAMHMHFEQATVWFAFLEIRESGGERLNLTEPTSQLKCSRRGNAAMNSTTSMSSSNR